MRGEHPGGLTKTLETTYSGGNLRVRGTSYRYAAWIPTQSVASSQDDGIALSTRSTSTATGFRLPSQGL